MNFEDQYQVMPWPLCCWSMDMNLDSNPCFEGLPAFEPRVFKSHQALSAEKQGCRYVCTVRDPVDTLKSWYYFTKSKSRMPEKLPDLNTWLRSNHPSARVILDDWFLNEWYMNRGLPNGSPTLAQHFEEFYKCRNVENVLVVNFEELVKDKERVIRGIAKWTGIDEEDNILRALKMSDMEFMKQNSGSCCKTRNEAAWGSYVLKLECTSPSDWQRPEFEKPNMPTSLQRIK